ncbi:MAG: hypothetical protein NVS1B4_05090 [Gemmatimonadaceae bacterium]
MGIAYGAGRRKRGGYIVAVTMCFVTALLLVAGSGRSAHASGTPCQDSLYRAERQAMGTRFEFYVYTTDSQRAAALFDEAFEEVDRIDALLSDYRPTSELSRLNAHAGAGLVTTDPEMFAFLARAVDYSRRTHGAFDITVGRFVDAWGFFGGAGRLPTAAGIDSARHQSGWAKVVLDSATRTVHYSAPRLRLDPGGIGKGYALDQVATILRTAGVTSALLSAGTSSVHAIGAPPGHDGWNIRVPDPRAAGLSLGSAILRDQSLSTSGRDGKSFRHFGRIYSHIIDPRTGYPVEGIVQTTVIAPTGMDTEALTKALFVLGPDEGRAVLRSVAGATALVVNAEGGVVRMSWPAVVAVARHSSPSCRVAK